MRGQIKNWNEERGFGFIATEEGVEDVFVHARDLPDGVLSLAAGQMVDFEFIRSQDGRPRGRVLSVDALAKRRPPPSAAAPAADKRVPVWTPERRTELADKAVDGLLNADGSPARVDAMRALLEAVFDDARME